MQRTIPSRAAAACGAVFAIALTAANGNGQGFSPGRYVAGAAALALFVPFLAGLWSVLREAEGPGGWLSTTVLGAGLVGIALKLASGAPDVAIHRAQVADGTQLHDALDGIAGAITVTSFFPLALMAGAVAVLALRDGALPRWLGIGAAVTAVALVANGTAPSHDSAPALLLFVLWTLVASVVLYRASPNSSTSAFANGVRGRSRRSPSKVTSTSSSKKATSPATGAASGSGSS
jgi:hypothetical protein